MIFGTQLVLHEYHNGILNRTFSQVTIQDVHLYLVSILTAVWLETLMRPIYQLCLRKFCSFFEDSTKIWSMIMIGLYALFEINQ